MLMEPTAKGSPAEENLRTVPSVARALQHIIEANIPTWVSSASADVLGRAFYGSAVIAILLGPAYLTYWSNDGWRYTHIADIGGVFLASVLAFPAARHVVDQIRKSTGSAGAG
jgi:hypothetical protein